MDRTEIDALKDRVDCLDIAKSLLCGKWKRFWCPNCQTRQSKTPDLAPKGKGFKCYKCGWGGDVIELVMGCMGCDFSTAIEYLGSNANWIPTSRQKPYIDTKAMPSIDPQERSIIYSAFLEGCRKVEGKALAYLNGRGIGASVVERMRLRFCGREYGNLMRQLERRFGKDKLLTVGLAAQGKKGPYPTFWPYYAAKIGFLVLPYIQAGQPIYLKARPPIDKTIVESKGIARFLNTGGAVPCLYNVDAIAGASQVLICEGETDTLTAATYDFAAVGTPGWGHFKIEWAGLFTGKATFLVLDADDAGDRGVHDIAAKFNSVGLALPQKLSLPRGQDLNEYVLRMRKTKS